MQWCGRCHGALVDAKNNGRWKSVGELMKYHSQGCEDHKANSERGAKDPIWSIWVWQPVSMPGDGGRDQM